VSLGFHKRCFPPSAYARRSIGVTNSKAFAFCCWSAPFNLPASFGLDKAMFTWHFGLDNALIMAFWMLIP
jgi:hypothetical protein